MVGSFLGQQSWVLWESMLSKPWGSRPISSTPPWLLHQLLPLGLCPVWVPVLTSFDKEQWYRSVSRVNASLPKLLWPWTTEHWGCWRSPGLPSLMPQHPQPLHQAKPRASKRAPKRETRFRLCNPSQVCQKLTSSLMDSSQSESRNREPQSVIDKYVWWCAWCPSQVRVFEHLVPRRCCYPRKFWNL